MAGKNEAKIKFTADTQQFNSDIKKSENELSLLRAELKNNATAMKGAGESTKLLKERQGLLKKELEANAKKQEALNNKLKVAEDVFGKDSDEAQKYRKKLLDAENAQKGMKNELTQVNSKLKTNARNFGMSAEKAKKFEDATKKAADISAGVATGIAGIALATAKQAADFEDSMAKVSTIAEDTEVELNGKMYSMRDAIMALSDETGRDANEIAESVYSAISAGQETAKSVQFVADSAKLAKGGFTEMEKSTDIITTALNAYNLTADKTGMVSDYLITTQNLGKVTVDQLASSMGKVIPTAKANNVMLDQLSTGYVLLTKQGINANQSTTLMKSLFSELGKTGSDTAVVLKQKTGKSFQELMKDGWSVTDVLKVIKEAADEQNLTMSDMFKKTNSATAANALFDKEGKTFNKTLKEMRKSTGATDAAVEKLSTTNSKARKTMNRIKNAGIEVGETVLTELEPTIDDFFKEVSEGAKYVSSHSDEVITAMKTVGTVAAGVFAVNKIAGVTKSVITVGTAIQGVCGKIGTLIGARAAETAAVEAETVATEGLAAAQVLASGGLIVAGMAAVTAGSIAVVTALQDTNEEYEKEREEIDKTVEKHNALKKELDNNKEARDKNIESVETEAKKAEILWGKIKELQGVEKKSAKQKEKMAELVSQLNEIYPDLGLSYDDAKDKLNKENDEIEKNIELKKKQAYVNALTANSEETLKDLVNAEMNFEDVESRYNKAKKAKDEAEAAVQALYKERDAKLANTKGPASQEYSDVNSEYEKKLWDARKKASDATSNLSQIAKPYKEAKKELKDLNQEYDRYQDKITAKTREIDIESQWKPLVEKAKKAGVDIPKSVSDGIEQGKYKIPKSVKGIQNIINYDSIISDAEKNGIKIPKSISNGVKTGETTVKDAIKQVNNWINFNSALNKAELNGVKVPKKLKEGIISGKTSVEEAMKQLRSKAGSVDFTSVGQKAGKQISSGFGNFKLYIQGIVDQVKRAKVKNHNAVGGIYKKGPFVTTFAEDSDEAAIPINNKPRSVNLWAETGRRMGILKNSEKNVGIQQLNAAVSMAETNLLLRKILAKDSNTYLDGKKVSDGTSRYRDNVDGIRRAMAERNMAYE